MPKLLRENTATGLVASGDRWKVTLAVPGQGSSGYYSDEVFRDYGPAAIPPGTRAYIGHPTESNPDRNQKDLLGTYPDGGVWNDEEGKFESELLPLPHWKEWLEAVAPHSALSIHMMGESDEAGNVTSFIPHMRNTVDLVDYPGLAGSGFDGKIEQLFESARAHSTKPGAEASVQNQKEGSMDKEVKEAIEALSAVVAGFVAEQKTASDAVIKAEADAKTAATSIEDALSAYNGKIAAIEAEKELFPSQVAALRAEALKGGDIVASIESAKLIATEALAAAKGKQEVAPTDGVILGSGAGLKTASEALPKGW